MKQKITELELRKLIAEELSAMNEAVDHVSISKIVKSASSLLKAVEQFEAASPSAAVMAGLGGSIEKMKKTLEDMLSNPSSYVDKPKPQQKIVSHGPKAVKKSDPLL